MPVSPISPSLKRASIVTSSRFSDSSMPSAKRTRYGVFKVGRRLDDDADRATRMQHLAARAEDFDQRHDLRADREDQVRMVMDSVSHVEILPRGGQLFGTRMGECVP